MKNEKIGIIGFGAIGQEIYKKISKKIINGYNIVGIFSNDINSKNISKNIKCKTFEQLLKKKPHIIIEAASVKACKDYAEITLRSKIDFVSARVMIRETTSNQQIPIYFFLYYLLLAFKFYIYI